MTDQPSEVAEAELARFFSGARTMYEANCVTCTREWSGRLTERQALLLRVAGVRCGACHGVMVVEPVLRRSTGVVRTDVPLRAGVRNTRGARVAS